LALIAAAPLWSGPGLVNTRAGGDSPFLFIRLHQLVENLRAGVFPARWMPDAAYGLGYPFFNFYAALPYYFAAAFALAGLDVLASLKIVQSLGFVLAAWAMYGWGKSSFGGRAQAWLAAAAYTVAPFHLVNVYVRGDSLSEFYAFVFYPLILWAVDGVVERPSSRSVALLGLAYGGLILTHNISALIFSPFVLLYMVIRDWGLGIGDWRIRHATRNTQHASRITNSPFPHSTFYILHSTAGLFLGLLISAWFWLPALGEAPLVQLDAQTTGYFNYAEHFRSTDLVEPSLGFDYSTEPPHTPFAMGLAQALVTLVGVVAMLVTWKRGLTRLRVFTLAGLTVSTLMMTPLSKPLWDTLPLLPLVQFPWRFLSVQALFASLAASFLVYAGGVERGQTSQNWIAAGVALALAASTLLTLRPDYLPIRADEIAPERIHAYEAFTTNVGTTIRAEYLPRTTIPRPYTGPALIDPAAPPRAIPVRGDAEAAQIAREPVSQSWSVHAADDAALAFPTLHFAGWQASLDGQRVEARAAADLGTIEVDVPKGEHVLTLWLDRTPLRTGAELISLAAALLTIGMLVLARQGSGARVRVRVRVRVRAMIDNDGRKLVARLWAFVVSKRYEFGLLAAACAFAVIASAANVVEARDDDLVMDFESKPWLHHGGADFGVARLARYTFEEPSTVALEWADVSDAGAWAVVQLVAPSSHTFGGPEPLESTRAPIRAGVSTVALLVPERLSRGMVYVRVDVADASRVYGSAFLRPLFNPGAGAAPPAAGWAPIGDEIELRAVAVEHDRPEQLTVAFDWAALKPIAANYAVSLRLADAAGRALVSLDTQPGYGFLPTSTWLPGENQHDVYTLTLPPASRMPPDSVYSLDVVWYRVASQQEIGRVRVPGIKIDTLYGETEAPPPQRSFAIPPMQHRVDATFGDQIRLLGYDLAQEGSRLILTLHWQALADIRAEYKYFVHVLEAATERIVAQADAAPGANAYPTSGWAKGEVVSERVELELGEGRYRVATGWYDPVGGNRLPVIDAQGNPAPSNRLLLGEQIRSP
jgi:hypothetical protein